MATAFSVALTIGSDTDTETGTPTEVFRGEFKVASAATDVAVVLGTLTNPQYIAVYGAEGISFKLGAAGTDVIGANPMALVMDLTGLGHDRILISNSAGAEVDVKVLAAE